MWMVETSLAVPGGQMKSLVQKNPNDLCRHQALVLTSSLHCINPHPAMDYNIIEANIAESTTLP
jgi:hypothetical protein